MILTANKDVVCRPIAREFQTTCSQLPWQRQRRIRRGRELTFRQSVSGGGVGAAAAALRPPGGVSSIREPSVCRRPAPAMMATTDCRLIGGHRALLDAWSEQKFPLVPRVEQLKIWSCSKANFFFLGGGSSLYPVEEIIAVEFLNVPNTSQRS